MEKFDQFCGISAGGSALFLRFAANNKIMKTTAIIHKINPKDKIMDNIENILLSLCPI